jgi:DNA-binding CsgD family transcriptional regulator
LDEHVPPPVSERLEDLYADRVATLPEAARRTLLLLAAADADDPPAAVRAALPDPDDKAWIEVEQAGLIRRAGRHLEFRHPLLRSAVSHAAPAAALAEAHRVLAATLADEPDRRAWHLAAATTRPDAMVSAELEQTADRARSRGGYAAAARALARAAELAPRRDEGTRLLVAAAETAVFTGDLRWVEDLADHVRARTSNPALLAAAALCAARLRAFTRHHSGAFPSLVIIAEDMAVASPSTALDALLLAAVLRFYSGDESQQREIARLLPRVPVRPADEPLRHWARIVSDPRGGGQEAAPLLPAMIGAAARQPERLVALAIAAWMLDETPLAIRTFDEAAISWRVQGPLPHALGGAAAMACLDYGRWAQAREICATIGRLAAAANLDHARACAHAVDAIVLAFQGETTQARTLAEEALRLIDPEQSRSVAVYARRALAAAAAAEGDHETAYQQARMTFDADGAPVHYHASYPALPELVEAALRSDHVTDAATIVERAGRDLERGCSPRRRSLLHRSQALIAGRGLAGTGVAATGLAGPELAGPGLAELGGPASAGPERADLEFRAALADPALESWPFERARARLEYGEWLRRQRRITEARTHLTQAHDLFRRLGSRPWAERAQAELRAAGLEAVPAGPGALDGLSPQQQEIVRLAARGLTNREIGERLFLSPRTVGSHLYRTFPKLGVTARSQLRDVIEGAGQ